MKVHEKLGPIGRQLCWLFNGIIIGSSIKWFLDETDDIPNDIDIVIPIDEWVKASKLIPQTAKANSFGGFKFVENDIEVDVWADDICRVLSYNKGGKAFSPRFGVYINATSC